MANDHITVKLPQLPPWPAGEDVRADDMIYVWDSEKGRLCHAPVHALPFGSGTGNGGTSTVLASPFMVGLSDPQVTVLDGTTTVSDARLLGKENYPVTATQINNAAFRPGEIAYDPLAGTATLPGFELVGGELLVLYPTGTAGGGAGGSLQPLWDELAGLRAMLAPFAPTAAGPAPGRVWWTGPPTSIPAGWEEDTAMRGYYPAHAPGPAAAGTTAGNPNNTVKLTGEQQGRFQFRVRTAQRKGGNGAGVQGVSMRPEGNGPWQEAAGWEMNGMDNVHTGARTIGLGNAGTAFDIRPKTKYGMWIRYVGA